MKLEKTKKITLLDYYSEKNRGDAAIQGGLIDMLKFNFPESDISVITAIGVNQQECISDHYFHTVTKGVKIKGGLFATLIHVSVKYIKGIYKYKPFRIVYTGLSLIFCCLLLFILKIKVPITFLRYVIPNKYYASLCEIAKADLIIWRGTNFRSGKSLPQKFIINFQWVYHALLSIVLRKKLICVGISMWPLHSWSRFLFKYTFSKCRVIAAREQKSYKILRKLLIKQEKKNKIIIIPDLSIVTLKEITSFHYPRSSHKFKNKFTIGITITNRFRNDEKGRQRYINILENLIKQSLEKNKSKIYFIPQTTKNWESSTPIINELIGKFNRKQKNRIENINREMSINDLVEQYKNLDLLIATRLHSSIFALSTGTPVYILRYDKGPQWGILDMLDVKEYVIDYEKTSINEIAVQYRNFLARTTNYPTKRILKNFNQAYNDIEKKFNFIRKSL